MWKVLTVMLAVVAAVLSGCGLRDGDPGSGPAGTSSASPRSRGSIAVTARIERTGHGYTEGAIPEVVLRDTSGHKVRTVRGRSRMLFTGLSPGGYVIEPALRPCDGNCGTLDGRTDACAAKVDVGSGITHVKVVYRVGETCKVHTGS